jgi:hypothetical protein
MKLISFPSVRLCGRSDHEKSYGTGRDEVVRAITNNGVGDKRARHAHGLRNEVEWPASKELV